MWNHQEALLYASTSANLYNFLGHKDIDSHLLLYKKIVQNSFNAHHDLNSFAAERVRVIDPDAVLSQLHTRPFIFVTFHTGSFNNLGTFLLTKGYQACVLADTGSVGNHDYNNVTRLYNNRYKNSGSIELINVEKEGGYRIKSNTKYFVTSRVTGEVNL